MPDRQKKYRAIFYPGPMHLFWTTGIYYLNELSKHFETTAILENATQEEVERVNLLTEGRVHRIFPFQSRTKLAKHWQYRRITKEIVSEIKPAIVVADHDMYPFEIYLLRESKRFGSLNICYQPGIAEGTIKDQFIRFLGTEAVKLQENYRIPYTVATQFAKAYFYAREFWYYFLGPILSGSLPFPGKSSAFVQRGRNGMRDSDYSIVFGEREKQIAIEDGVPECKIVTIPHPLTWRVSKNIREQLIGLVDTNHFLSIGKPLVVLFLEHSMDSFRLRRETGEVISKKEIYSMWENIVRRISDIFFDAVVLIKKHPAQKADDSFLLFLKKVTRDLPNTIIIEENILAMALASKCSVIVSETSTVLYTASLYFANKEIVSLDLDRKLLGDVYRGTAGITYISDFQQLGKIREQAVRSPRTINYEATNNGGDKFIELLNQNLN